MRNFLKYPNIRFGMPDGVDSLNGANFSSAKKVELKLDDNIITFKAPRHDPLASSIEQRRPWHGHNALECNRIDSNLMPSQKWSNLPVFLRDWVFCGPWFTGALTSLSCSGLVITRSLEEVKGPSYDLSFFHPKAFESELCEYLTDYYGHRGEDAAYYMAPLNWQPNKINSLFSCRYDLASSGGSSSRDHYVAFPITEKHFFIFSFGVGTRNSKPINIKDGKCDYMQTGPKRFAYDEAPLLELMESIIGSINIQLSPKNQAAYDRIKTENPDLEMKLSDTMLPLKWTGTPTKK